jgi:hypothetical protein
LKFWGQHPQKWIDEILEEYCNERKEKPLPPPSPIARFMDCCCRHVHPYYLK